ncbi:hypothetical protein GRAN_3466 [Granulicella sibirica]|uniref:Flagellar biosynthesis protein FliO n=2 Tax=Granulicella sibirica TaxID=2479048 RepID=A0A4Q0T3P9_9BACT|nr:hypothetical protein GRAN_3466 [Granulicella sibirica]
MELVRGGQRDRRQDDGPLENAEHVSQAALPLTGRRIEGVAGWLLGLIHHRIAGSERRSLKVLETLNLGGGRQVALISCAGERYLVGMGSDSVETIVCVGDSSKTALEDVCL